MLTPLDDTPWHQIPSTFDHVGTSDPRFFDRLWFAASDPAGGGTLQFTIGVYQNMNVVDGGAVVISGGRQHNVRASRQLRPDYETACGPLRIEVVEPMEHLRLHIGGGDHGVQGKIDWRAAFPAQEEHPHFRRRTGRVLEDYNRYDQIGTASGWLEIHGTRMDLPSWWACRDHSWGVRERVGIAEPVTGEQAAGGMGLFAFLFYSTEARGGHVQVARGLDGSNYLSAAIVDRATGAARATGERAEISVAFVNDQRPRRMRRVVLDVTATDGTATRFDLEALGPSVAMPGLGYGGYNDGLGLGVWRGVTHLEHDTWDVTDPAAVRHADGTVERPVHRIQPVRVTETGPEGTSTGTGSLTFLAEGPVDGLTVLDA